MTRLPTIISTQVSRFSSKTPSKSFQPSAFVRISITRTSGQAEQVTTVFRVNSVHTIPKIFTLPSLQQIASTHPSARRIPSITALRISSNRPATKIVSFGSPGGSSASLTNKPTVGQLY